MAVRNVVLIALVTLLIAPVWACGEDPLERLEEASQALEEARDEVASAEQQVEQKREALRKSKAELEEELSDLEQARERLSELESEVGMSITDDLLFRSVQSRLLGDDKLEPVAITASVNNAVVTLSGRVPSDALRERALEVARETPGVKRVEDRIQVVGSRGGRTPEPSAPPQQGT